MELGGTRSFYVKSVGESIIIQRRRVVLFPDSAFSGTLSGVAKKKEGEAVMTSPLM
jgi:hypothetical protein